MIPGPVLKYREHPSHSSVDGGSDAGFSQQLVISARSVVCLVLVTVSPDRHAYSCVWTLGTV